MSASRTRFGEIPFRVLRRGPGAEIAPGWDRQSHTSAEHVPGSDTTITFLLGRGPLVATWTIESPSIADYRDLDAALQTTATLVLPNGTSNAPAVEVNEFGVIYDHIANVTLMELSNSIVRMGGKVQADVTFQIGSA